MQTIQQGPLLNQILSVDAVSRIPDVANAASRAFVDSSLGIELSTSCASLLYVG